MKSFILYFGIALFLVYIACKIFWDITGFIESFKKNDEKESSVVKKAAGKITFILLLCVAVCVIILKLAQ